MSFALLLVYVVPSTQKSPTPEKSKGLRGTKRMVQELVGGGYDDTDNQSSQQVCWVCY